MIVLKTTGGISSVFPDYIFSTQRVSSVIGDYVVIDGTKYDMKSLVKVDDNDANGSTNTNNTPVTDLSFDGNRIVKRSGLPAINPNSDTVIKFLNNYFYPQLSPSVRLQILDESNRDVSQFLYGESTTIRVRITVTLNDATDTIVRHLVQLVHNGVFLINQFGSGLSITIDVPLINVLANTFNTSKGIFEANLVGITEFSKIGNFTSPSMRLQAYYPIFVGASGDSTLYNPSTDFVYKDSQNQNMGAFTRSSAASQTYIISSNNEWRKILFAIPNSYLPTFYSPSEMIGTLVKIIDQNGFDVSDWFECVSGVMHPDMHGFLSPAWTAGYAFISSKTTTVSNSDKYTLVLPFGY